jgi:hypothetical protein
VWQSLVASRRGGRGHEPFTAQGEPFVARGKQQRQCHLRLEAPGCGDEQVGNFRDTRDARKATRNGAQYVVPSTKRCRWILVVGILQIGFTVHAIFHVLAWSLFASCGDAACESIQ